MSDTVWLVTSGSYSDYQVHCVAPTREVAEQIRERLGADDVDERPLLANADAYIELVSYAASVAIKANGRIGQVFAFRDRYIQPPSRPRAGADSFGNVSIRIQAASPEAGRHAVAEYAAELAAELAAGAEPKDVVFAFNQRHEARR
jgi:hypothetical protein